MDIKYTKNELAALYKEDHDKYMELWNDCNGKADKKMCCSCIDHISLVACSALFPCERIPVSTARPYPGRIQAPYRAG